VLALRPGACQWPNASCLCRFPDEDDVALLGDEAAAGQIAHESLIDRRFLEGEVVDVLSQRQFSDGELIFD
jgi:hypothetical protein